MRFYPVPQLTVVEEKHAPSEAPKGEDQSKLIAEKDAQIKYAI